MKKGSHADAGLTGIVDDDIRELDAEVIQNTKSVNQMVLEIVKPLSERLMWWLRRYGRS